MQVVRSSISCGVRQIYDLAVCSPGYGGYKEAPNRFLHDFYNECDDPEWHRQFKFAMFSHNYSGIPMCDSIAKFIEDNKLGTVTVSKTETNPNSNYNIKVYIWDIDWTNLLEWLSTHSPETVFTWR